MGAFTMTYLYIGIIITTHIFVISQSHIDLFSNFTEESFYIMFKIEFLKVDFPVQSSVDCYAQNRRRWYKLTYIIW